MSATDYRTKAEKDAADRFKSETANHRMRILHDDGLYRHLKFANPDTGTYYFHLITAPNTLIFKGDGESFVFSCYPTEDLFALFRQTAGGGINASYWSQKLTSNPDGFMSYSQDLFNEQVAAELKDAEDYFPGVMKAWNEKVNGFFAEYNTENEDEARRALDDFEYLPEEQYGEAWSFRYTSEWDLQDYDWWYLFACHAIVAGIAQYDAAKAAGQVAA